MNPRRFSIIAACILFVLLFPLFSIFPDHRVAAAAVGRSSLADGSPTPEVTGLNIRGSVTLNGVGLAGVRIYRRSAGYEGVLVATTGADGRYQADFMYIPGDEMITVWAQRDGYTFTPAEFYWRHYHGLEDRILDFTAQSSSGVAFDFTSDLCAARWVSGAGNLPCPLADGDARGFALRQDHPSLENGVVDSQPGLLLAPQNKYNGYIQGYFPEYTVQPGDHFQASVGCAQGFACYVTYRLEYSLNGVNKILWTWKEKNEGKIYQLDKDLSSLAGKKVSFVLTLLATGPATGDRAIWGQPRIISVAGPGPSKTPTVSPTPSSTPVVTSIPAEGTLLDFAASACAASWSSGAGALPCPGAEGDGRGFALPVSNPQLENGAVDNALGLVMFPQYRYNGFIRGVYPAVTVRAGDRFQAIVNCSYGYTCYATFRLYYQVGNGPVNALWWWTEKNEGQFYRVDKDLSSLAGKNVKFILQVSAVGPPTDDRALWGQPRIVRPGLATSTPTSTPTPYPTFTPTDTPLPAGRVTGMTAAVSVPEFVNCAGSMNVALLGSITTDGPATVNYHWEVVGVQTNSTPETTLVFTEASTQAANVGAYGVNCGNYLARLVVTSPSASSAQAGFTLVIPTLLPIYDFNTFQAIGAMSCSEVPDYEWVSETCNGESGGCRVSQVALFGRDHAGYLRFDGNLICNLNLP